MSLTINDKIKRQVVFLPDACFLFILHKVTGYGYA